MNDLLKKVHAWLIKGTDRQLFRRSLLLLLVLAVFLQIGLNTGDQFSYLGAVVVGIAYAYVWLELVKRFTGKEKDNDRGNRKNKNDDQDPKP